MKFVHKCSVSSAFAYMMFAYIIGIVYYIIFTRNIGTPFRDSLTQEQIEIKKTSAVRRKIIFYTGIVGGIIILFITRPFSGC